MTEGTKRYVYRWNRCGRKGHLCKVTARGTMNSACVEFEDGFRMITSRNALKKAVESGDSLKRDETQSYL